MRRTSPGRLHAILQRATVAPVPARHVHRLRVRYAECDAQGVLFNAHYLAYFDISLTELFRAGLGSYGAMLDGGVDLVVVEATIRYRSPARFDDELDLTIEVERFGTSSMLTAHRIVRAGELLAEGTMAYVFVDGATGAKTPVPQWIRDGLSDPEVAD